MIFGNAASVCASNGAGAICANVRTDPNATKIKPNPIARAHVVISITPRFDCRARPSARATRPSCGAGDGARDAAMRAANPQHVLRNHLGQQTTNVSRGRLFLLSFLMLFVELSLIRWLGS